MRRVWGHFRRGSDEELPSFEEAVAADARLRGAARLAVLDASRLQRRSARAFRSWNAHTVSLIVSDAREKQYAAQLRAKDGENAQKISEALSEAYAGHAAELAAQAREHEESKQLALAGQRASFEGKTPTKKKKTPGKGQHSDKLVEKAFADRQSRHDDAIKSLRRSHDAKLVALKASHAKELTMVKTAISLEKDQERAVAVNDALREAEKIHTERMKERTCVIEGRTPCKTPGRERAARATADDVSPETLAQRAAPGAARSADLRALCLVLNAKARHRTSVTLASRFAAWGHATKTTTQKARAARLLRAMTDRIVTRVSQQRAWRLWRDILIAKRVFVEAEVRQREIGEENEARLRLLRVDYDQLTAERQHDLDNDLQGVSENVERNQIERFSKELETQKAKLVRQNSQHAHELQTTQSKLLERANEAVVKAVRQREQELEAAHALVLHDLNKQWRSKMAALVDKQQGDVDYLRVSCTTELESAVDSLKFEHERELSARRKAQAAQLQSERGVRDAALTAIRAAETAARKARAAKLLCSAFARWARSSEAGAFVFWHGVTRTVLLVEDARTRAARLFGLSLQRWALKSQACAFVCWRSTTSQLLLIDDRRRRAAVLFEQALCRLARTSQGGAFAWWTGVVRHMRRADEARERAARLFALALQRCLRQSMQGSFVWWSKTTRDARRLAERQTLAMKLFVEALQRTMRRSEGGAFTWWRRVASEARASDEARVHAANLFGQALTRLAHKHTGGCFMLWRRTLRLQDQYRSAARLFGQALCRLARKSASAAFLWWRRFTAIARDAEATRLRLLEAEQAATTAKQRAAIALERVTRRWARTCVDGSFEWWHRCAAFAKAAEAQQYRAALQLQRAFGHWAQKSAAGAFLWWRRVVSAQKALESATRARERALAVLERVAVRYLRRSVSGSFDVWRRAVAIEQQRRRGVHLFDVVLRRWATRSKAAAFLRLQREADIQRQLLASEMRHAAARDRYDSQKEAEAAEALRELEARLVNEFAAQRAAFERDAGERLAAERSSLMSQHAAALAALATERARSEELLANQSDADVTVLRNEYALQTDRTAAAHACALAEARLLYGDDLAELQGQLDDAQQALREAPEPVDNQDELLALEAEASAQVRGMSLSMAVVFFSNALEARSRRLLARAFAVLKAAAASASAVALRDIDHADALREVVLESNKAAARVTGSSDLARVLWTFMRRRHVGAWNQWRRVALYQRFCNERDILLEAHASELSSLKEEFAAEQEANRDAAQLELEDAVARALSDGERASLKALADREALAESTLEAREQELLAYHGADMDALDAKHQREIEAAVAEAEQRMRAQREAAERVLVETHRSTLKSAQSTYEAAVKAALADKDRARLLQARKQALQRVLRVLRRWLRESLSGSFVWWRRAVTQSLEGQDLTAVRLLERTVARIGRRHVGFSFACWLRAVRREKRREHALRAFDRSLRGWSRSSVAASFVFWASVVRNMRLADEAKDRAARLLCQALNRMARASEAGSFVWWRRVAFDARASDEARVHAANLFSQALTRLAHKHTGGCFMVWKHALWLEDQQKHAARLLEQAIGRMVRGSVAGAFTWWQRVSANATAALLAKHRASRALTRVMRRWSRVSIAGAYLWWARATRDERALEDSKRLATQLFTRALERLARKSWTAAYLLWRKRTTDARNADSSRSQGALLVTRALRGARERRAVLKSFLMWKAVSAAVARYLAIEDERERDHDDALRKAVSGMRTALLKASAGSALIRITRRSRFFQSFRTWKALSVQAVATRRLNRVCRRWVRTSVYGSYAWWRRVVADAAATDEARKRAARLFGQALQRWSLRSRSCAFVFWKLVATEARAADELHGRSLRLLDQALGRLARKSVAGALLYWRRTLQLEDQRNAAMVAFGRVMRRWLRNSVAAAFIYWNRVVADLSALEDTRHHAAVLFEQALCRLARTSRGAAFAWWSRVVRNMRRADEAQERAARLLGQALNRMARASQAGAFVWWRGVVREAVSTDAARKHASILFEQALCRFARKSVQGAFAWWLHVLRLQDRHRAAARLFGQAFCRLARSSEGASFVWWRGVVKQEIEAEARQRRSAAAMERVVRRFARMSVTGSFAWWRHVAGNIAAAEEQRLLASKLLARGLEMWARKSSSAAFMFWQRQNAQMKQIEDSWAQGTKRMWRSFRRLAENRVRRFFLRWRSNAVPRQPALGDPRERLHQLLRRAVLRWEHTTEAVAFACWRRRTASYSSRELSLHFLERVVRRHAKKSLHTNLLAWRLRAKHTAVSAVAGAAKRRYEDFLRLDARCAALVAEAARRSEVHRLQLLLLRGSCVDAGLWMLAGRHANSRKRALRRGFDACGRALRRFRVMNRCVRRLAHFHAAVALNRWRVAAGARTRAIAALRAYGLHLNARGRADALQRSLATWRRACDGGALRLQLEARDAAAARAAADAAAEIRAVREEVNDAVRAATRRVREARDDREAAMLDAQRRDLSLRHTAELEFLEAEGDARTKRLVLGGVCARWARRSRAGAFVFWRESRRALDTTKSRSLTLLPRLVHSLSMRCERRQLTKALRQMRRNALDIRRRQINASQGIRKLRRRLAIWIRQRSHAALATWRENAHDKQWRLALACGRVYQCMRRRSRWRRRAAWRIWCERVKDIPRACQLLSRLLHRSAISRLMGAFRQWNDHYSFMYELHKALGKSVLKQKQELLETKRKLKRSQETPNKATQRVSARNRALESMLREREAKTDKTVAALQNEVDTLRRRVKMLLEVQSPPETPPRTPSRRTSFDSPRSRTGSFRSKFDVAAARFSP